MCYYIIKCFKKFFLHRFEFRKSNVILNFYFWLTIILSHLMIDRPWLLIWICLSDFCFTLFWRHNNLSKIQTTYLLFLSHQIMFDKFFFIKITFSTYTSFQKWILANLHICNVLLYSSKIQISQIFSFSGK